MQVIAHILHPLGKLSAVHYNMIVGVPVREQPAVVDVHVLVPEAVEAQVQYPLRIRLNHLLVDVAAVVVPRVPAHCRRQTQAVVEGVGHLGESRSES